MNSSIIHDYDETRFKVIWSALRKNFDSHEVQKDSLDYEVMMHLSCHIFLYHVCQQYALSFWLLERLTDV